MVPRCQKCGAEVLPDNQACPHCGDAPESKPDPRPRSIWQVLAKRVPWIFKKDIAHNQRIDKSTGGWIAIGFGLLSLIFLLAGIGSFSRDPLAGILGIAAGIIVWMGMVLPIMRRVNAPTEVGMDSIAKDQVASEMPHPELLENESLVDIIGSTTRSLSVTSFRIIEIDEQWEIRTEKILQLDEIDSYRTARISNKNLLVAAVLTLISSVATSIYFGNQPKLEGPVAAYTLFGGILLTVILWGCYRASIRFEMIICSKRMEIRQIASGSAGLVLYRQFLNSVQKAVQVAKKTKVTP